MRIILAGGGTGGSVTPLLAIYQELKKEDQNNFLFIGGKSSLEKDLADEHNIHFKSIVSGKLRRYFDLRNFLTPVLVIIAFVQSLIIIIRFKPNIILSAGSFIAVPVVWAGWLLRVPSVIHQQDIKKGLANSLMSPFAKKITVTFPVSLRDFSRKKTILTGNPIRKDVIGGDKEKAYQLFNLERNLPNILILGGGTGALSLNKIVNKALPQLLSFCQIIHIAGKGKNIFQDNNLRNAHRPESFELIVNENEKKFTPENIKHYHVYEFLSDELKHVLKAADIVVTRAGMSMLSELALLGKTIIIIPLPGTHQELNARYFTNKKAALTLNQKSITSELLTNFIHELLQNEKKQKELSDNIKKLIIPNATGNIIKEIFEIYKQKDGSS